MVSLFGAPIWRPTKSEYKKWGSWWNQHRLVFLHAYEDAFYVLRYLKIEKEHESIGMTFENFCVSSCHELDQITSCFIYKTKQCIDMKLSLKINLTSVLNVLKKAALCWPYFFWKYLRFLLSFVHSSRPCSVFQTNWINGSVQWRFIYNYISVLRDGFCYLTLNTEIRWVLTDKTLFNVACLSGFYTTTSTNVWMADTSLWVYSRSSDFILLLYIEPNI